MNFINHTRRDKIFRLAKINKKMNIFSGDCTKLEFGINTSINLTYKDLNIISMSLYDNVIIGHLNKNEYNLSWNIIERIYESTSLSKSDLKLICDSLRRYSIKYDYELLEARECKRVYDMIQEAYKNE